MSQEHGNTRELEARIEELERKLAALTGYCEDLEERIVKLAVAKVPEPRFPYWNWQLGRRMSTEDRRRLSIVLSALDERAQGSRMPVEFQKDIEGISRELLYSDRPLEPAEAFAAIKAVTGMKLDAGVIELLEAAQGQGMFRDLCRFLLTTPEE